MTCSARDVATLGMFILDTFQFQDAESGQDLGDKGLGVQIGGGGTYFAVAASMWLGPARVLMIVDVGKDFPDAVQRQLEQYARANEEGEGAIAHNLWRYRPRSDGTTRAVNIYRGEERGFAYLTPKVRLDPIDLVQGPQSERFFPRFIHFICSPSRASEICKQLDEHSDKWKDGIRPITIWEPIPDSAKPENLNAALQVCRGIDVLSPNHDESASFLSQSLPKSDPRAIESMDRLWRSKIGDCIQDTFGAMICIRSGALGCHVSRGASECAWTPAYHTPKDADKIVDVTGAGNAWLGGFVAGLALQAKPDESLANIDFDVIVKAAQMGSVSASYTIEQLGLPHKDDRGARSSLWNGEKPEERLQQIQARFVS